uniref:Secreted protein n=1 Tax=Anopheles darlingi TaxID=43151 RepID=A0A2M4D588_ANODA
MARALDGVHLPLVVLTAVRKIAAAAAAAAAATGATEHTPWDGWVQILELEIRRLARCSERKGLHESPLLMAPMLLLLLTHLGVFGCGMS